MSRHGRAAPAATIGLVALVAAVALAACSSTPAATTAPLPPDAVAVTAMEYEFAPVPLAVPAGEVTFAVTNAGNETHEFEVLQGEATVDKVSVAAGSTKTLTVMLAAGDYVFMCRLNGHDILGMKGSLTVD